MSKSIAMLLTILLTATAQAAELKTVAEQSDFKRTGRYEEVERLCKDFERGYPKQVRCFEFGRTPEGRAMWAIAASADGALTSGEAQRRHRAVVLMQGGIHAGEIDGKDAGFWALRDALDGRIKNALQNVTWVFVPVFNVDGHERFGRNNRPNQIGPEEMGWRTTAQNLNLNRDYVKAEAPEMQAMLRLLNEWDPIVYADLHVTDGAEFEHDISINVAPTLAGDAALRQAAVGLRDDITKFLRSKGSLPLDFYPSLVRDDDPTSGFAANISQARFSHQYWALRNRIGILVETHSWKDYKTRVRGTYHSIVEILQAANRDGVAWRAAADEADQHSRNLNGARVPLSFTNTNHFKTIEYRGYAYTRDVSPIAGVPIVKYDNTKPEVWRIPFYDEVIPAAEATAPRAGYIVPAAWAELVGNKLKAHGIDCRRINEDARRSVQVFRADKAQFSSASNEARQTLNIEGAWRTEERTISNGSLFVPIQQSKAALIMTLFESKSGDSLLEWGFFNAAFERKEYMEAYVADEVAREMLRNDAALKIEFENKLKNEPEFAKNPQARLEFFYRRHPSWDERFNLYPIYRADRKLELAN